MQGVETTKTVDVERRCLFVDMIYSKFTEYRALECCLTCWRAFRSVTDNNTVTDPKDNTYLFWTQHPSHLFSMCSHISFIYAS